MRGLFLLCCAACGYDHGVVAGDGALGGDDATMDGAIDDATMDGAIDGPPMMTLCGTATPLLDEEFDGTSPCTGWATTSANNTSMTNMNGRLRIAPSGNNANGQCNGSQAYAWGAGGVIVEVPSVLTGNDNYTLLRLNGVDRTIVAANGMLYFVTNNGATRFAMTAYSATAMRWWRARPTTNAVVAEVSADGLTWTLVHSQATTIQNVTVAIMGGTQNNGPNGMAEFGRLVVCP
jgi:hypothetical protein